VNIVSKDKLDLLKELTNNKKNSDDFNTRPNTFDFLKSYISHKYKQLVIFTIILLSIIIILIISNYAQQKTITSSHEKEIESTPSIETNDNLLPTAQSIILSASGYVVPRRISTIAAEITGRITEIYIEEGQKVNKGDLIAKLDATLAITDQKSAKAKLASAESLVNSLQAKYKKAKFIANSKDKLFRSGVVSKEIYIQSQTEEESLEADIAKAENDIKLAQIEIAKRNELVERHFLRSPFNGVITSKDAHPGEVISPASGGGGFTRTGIATIVDMDSLEVEVDVNESNINKVFTEQNVNIILEAYPEKVFNGFVIAIIPNANRDKATIKVRIGFNKIENIIFPNMAVKVDFLEK
jgi:HlyD family secretion protein